MTDAEMAKIHGDALFASFMATAIMVSLRPIDRAVETVDRVLLTCEEQLASPNAPVAALQHARQLLQKLHHDMIEIQRIVGIDARGEGHE